MRSINDLDGLALTLIAEQLPLADAAALAATCRRFHSVLAAVENVAFWKRVAGEVWGVVGSDAPGAIPRLPGGAGAGEEAESWKQTCVEHSRLLSRFGRDAGGRAAGAWHRIEAALATAAPEVLATLAPGRTLSDEKCAGRTIHPEVLAAAALHNGTDFRAGIGDGDRGDFSDAAATRCAQLGLFGAAVIYGEGFSRWMRTLLPKPGQELARCFAHPPPAGVPPDDDGRVAGVSLHVIASSFPAGDPTVECRSLEGSSCLALALDSAEVYVTGPVHGPFDSIAVDRGWPLIAAKRADGSRGLLFFLGELAAALETGQLAPERDGFFRGGAMAVAGLDAAEAAAARRGRPPTRGLSRFAAAPPGLASRETAGALVVSRSVMYTWMSRVSRLTTEEAHVFSYRVHFKLLSVAEQRRRRQQQGQQGQRVIRRATLLRRHWEITPSRGGTVQVVDGEGVVGFFPTLIANDDDAAGEGDGEGEHGGEGENVDDDDSDPSSFCYCSRVNAPEDDTDENYSPPGKRLGSVGGHFLLRVEYEDGTTGNLEAAIEPFEMVVPSVIF